MKFFEKEIHKLKSQIINLVFVYYIFLIIPAVIISLFRAKDTGYQPFMFFYSSAVFVISVLLIFRKRISLEIRSGAFIVLFVLTGFGALYTYGLTSLGFLWFVVSTVLATLLINRRIGRVVLLISIILSLFVFILLFSDLHKFNIDFYVYNYSISSWLSHIVGLCFVLIVIVYGIGTVYNYLINNIVVLQEKSEALEREIEKGKLYEQELKSSEERYKTLSDLTFEGIIIHKNGITTDVNKSFLKLLGYKKEEVIGENVINKFVSENDRALAQIKIKESFTGAYEVSVLHKNGNDISVELQSHDIQLDGAVHRVTSVRDLTYKKNTEKIFLENERKRAIDEISLTGSEIGLYEYNAQKGLFEFGRGAHKIYGRSLEGMPRTLGGFESMLHEQDKKECLRKLKETINSDKPNWAHEYRIVKEDGSIVWIRDRATLKRDENKVLLSAFGTIVDITQFKEIEKNLRETQKWLNIVLENIQSLVFIKDIEGKYILVNKEYELMLGIDRKNILGKTDFDLYPKGTASLLRQNDLQIIKDKKAKSIEEKGQIHSGEIRTYLSNKVPLIDSKGKTYALCGFGTDITYLKKIENDLKESQYEQMALNEELRAINEELYEQKNQLEKAQMQLIQSEKMASIGILSAGVAHEINNPVNYISSGMIGLKKCYKKLIDNLDIFRTFKDEDLLNTYRTVIEQNEENINQTIEFSDEMFHGIQEGIDKTIQIIESMRVFSRSSEDLFDQVNVNEIIDNVLVMLHNTYKNKVVIKKSYCELATIDAVSGKLYQAFMNIISNAVQAITEKGEINISTFLNKDKLLIKIKDNGIGISDKDKNKIFDPFFTSKDVGAGTGLGLYITYNIIEQHNGSINYKSKQGKGTEFIIELPKEQ